MLQHHDPACNLHVFSPGCPEPERHLIFRDWLREHPDDRRRYAAAKTTAAAEAAQRDEHVQQYNARKTTTLRDIYRDACESLGLLD